MPLGVLTKCEQVGEDMIDILTHVHKYVYPSKKTATSFLSSLVETNLQGSGLVELKMHAYKLQTAWVDSKESYRKWRIGTP